MSSFKISQTRDALDLPLPSYQTGGSSGMDLYANIISDEVILPSEVKLIPAGIKISLPRGYEAQTRPRSGLALRNGISLLNSPGTVDSDYRGEIKLIMFNFSKEPFTIKRGDRIAQLVIAKVETADFILVEENDLDETDRSDGGFGHTGV